MTPEQIHDMNNEIMVYRIKKKDKVSPEEEAAFRAGYEAAAGKFHCGDCKRQVVVKERLLYFECSECGKILGGGSPKGVKQR